MLWDEWTRSQEQYKAASASLDHNSGSPVLIGGGRSYLIAVVRGMYIPLPPAGSTRASTNKFEAGELKANRRYLALELPKRHS
jgi:hypothetical protein